MKTAPDIPTTETLNIRYPLSLEGRLKIEQTRLDYDLAINSPEEYTLGIIGYCALPSSSRRDVVKFEGEQISGLSDPVKKRLMSHRMPPWKSRSDPEDWHGEETTDPNGAYETIRNQA